MKSTRGSACQARISWVNTERPKRLTTVTLSIQRAAGDRGDGGIAIHVIGVFLVIHIDVPAVPGCGPVLESHKPVAAGAGQKQLAL